MLVTTALMSMTLGETQDETLGERVLRLQSAGLPDTLSFPTHHYVALVDSLATSIDASLSRQATHTERFLAFTRLTGELHAITTRDDILAQDLADRDLDCTSLAILMHDVWATAGDSLAFVVRARHVFLTDGKLDYDPLHGTCEPAGQRYPTAMEVTGGAELVLSMSERAMGEWLATARYDEAEDWFIRAQGRAQTDPLTNLVWGEVAFRAGETATAEAKFRELVAAWPDAALSNYALGRFLLSQGDMADGRWYLDVGLGLAESEGDARLCEAIAELLR